MALSAGRATNYTMTLRVGGAPVVIPPTALLTAQLQSPDSSTQFSGQVTALSTSIGADWAHGVAVFEFDAANTASIAGSQVLLIVTLVAGGNTRNWSVLLDVAGGIASALFVKDEVIEAVRRDRFLGTVSSLVDPSLFSDAYIWDKLLAAEADASRQLRVFLKPTYCLPFPVPQTDVNAVPSGVPWVEEPGYDYEPDLFQGEGWGFLVARHKPIISVDYIQFAYPQPMNTVWNLPLEWLRLDKKYGHIRIVPAGTSYSAPFSAWMMQVLGGGRNIPQMIRIRYKAGLENAAVQYPDLVDMVMKMAVLRIIDDALPVSSESVSADGLSQSRSIDLSPYRDSIKSKMDTLMDAIHGVRAMVF